MNSKITRFLLAIAGFAALLLFPVAIDNPYYIHLLETIMIYAILLFGLDIVVGYTGQVSLGHAGLFGLGAYTAGVLVYKLGAPLMVALIASIGVTARCWRCPRCGSPGPTWRWSHWLSAPSSRS
jgi:branched-chain amino acid transport system permease protein